MKRRPPRATLCPYTTLFRSEEGIRGAAAVDRSRGPEAPRPGHGQRLDATGERHLAAVRSGGPRCHGQAKGLLYIAKDRKSTRLNSSHANISYAVFCLKKKTT